MGKGLWVSTILKNKAFSLKYLNNSLNDLFDRIFFYFSKQVYETRPIACQLYPGLTTKQLYNFLTSKGASNSSKVYYIRRLQKVTPNYMQEYLERNGVPYPYKDTSAIISDSDVSNNAFNMSTDWMTIISQHSAALPEFSEKSYYKFYYGSQDLWQINTVQLLRIHAC